MNKPGDALRQKALKIRDFLRGDALRIAGVEGVKHFKKSFQDEGFTDEVLEKWTPSKRKSDPTSDYQDRPTLTQEGDLAASVEYTTDLNKVVFQTDYDWAKIHNEGGPGLAWGKHPFTMPKRQFMGRSKVLERAITVKFEKRLIEILKS